jgi:hypothetical protein
MVWRVLALVQSALCFWERTGQVFSSVFFTLPSRSLSLYLLQSRRPSTACQLSFTNNPISLYLLKSWRLSTACHLSFTNNSGVDSQKLPSYRPSLAREAEPHRNVSWPFTVHLAWCTSSGCWFTLPYSTDSVSPPPFCYVGMCFWGPAPKWVSPTSIHSSKGLSTID